MKATAYIVESGGEPDVQFINTVKSAGFSSVESYSGLNAVETRMAETPLCFFLFPHAPQIEPLRKVVGQVRNCKRRNVRFSPLIYFCRDPSHELIRSCLAVGFDDVISLPQSPSQIVNRLNRQMRRPIAYFETPHYFGPDRRDEGRSPSPGPSEAQPRAKHQQFEFIREETGISITARHTIAA